MSLQFKRRIADQVHGTIPITEVEDRVINTASFQRLREVKQLGLAHFVFPGADYSRFSHSIGACHVMGKILDALVTSGARGLPDDRAIQQHRLAALLHDVGHYPFSHTTEHAIENTYKAGLLGPGVASTGKIQPFINHEVVGQRLVKYDDEIATALKDGGFTDNDMLAVFRRGPGPGQGYANLISSDLDADRIDYLLRTAHHTGLPYGTVDVDYLLSQIAVDKDDLICFRRKALRAAEHLLLCRYFDYMQVAYHKVVASLEWLLGDVVTALVVNGYLKLRPEEVLNLIRSGGWRELDDGAVVAMARKLAAETKDAIVAAKINAILYRKPPRLIASEEYIDTLGNRVGFVRTLKMLKPAIAKAADRFGLDSSQLHLWSLKKGMRLTKIGARVDVDEWEDGDPEFAEAARQSVRILEEDKSSTPLVSRRESLLNVLSERACYMLRIYFLPLKDQAKLEPELKAFFAAELAA